MASKWSIIPNDSATIDDEGKVNFKVNKNANPIEYTITYKDDECSANTTVIQNGNVCENYKFSKSSTTLSYSAGSEGFFASSDTRYFDALIVSNTLPSWLSVSSTASGNICRYKARTTSANMSGRQNSFVVKFKPSDSDLTCPEFSATVIQNSVTCSNYTFLPIENSIGYREGSSGYVASSNSSLSALTATTTPAWVRSVTPKKVSGVWKYIATVDANTTTGDRSGEIVFAPTDSSISCSNLKATVNQQGNDCGRYNFTAINPTVEYSSTTYTKVATSKASEGTLTVKSNSLGWATSSRTENSNIAYYVKPSSINSETTDKTCSIVYKSNDGCENFNASLKQKGVVCSDYQFSAASISVDSEAHSNVVVAKSVKILPQLSFKTIPTPLVSSTSVTSDNSSYFYMVNITKNETTDSRNGTVIFETNNGTCSDSFRTNISQELGCGCDSFEWDETTQKTISSDGGNLTISHTNGCVTPSIKYYNGSTETTKPSWITNVTNNNNNTVFTIANNTGDERTVSVSMIVNNTECKRYTITQYEQHTPEIQLNATFYVQGYCQPATNPIFNSLEMWFKVNYKGEEIYRKEFIKIYCPCDSDCREEYKTFSGKIKLSDAVTILEDDEDLSNYSIDIWRYSAIAKERDNSICDYKYNGWECQPLKMGMTVTDDHIITTFDNITNGETYNIQLKFIENN